LALRKSHAGMRRYWLFPLRGAAAALVATFTLGLWLASHAGWMGIPLALLLTSWFFKYCFILLDAVIAGAAEPPVLSIEMVNPIDEQRPLAQALLIAGGALLALELGKLTLAAVGWLCGALLLLLLPASVAVLAMSGNPLRAVWPPELLSLIRGMGWDYAWLICSILTLALLVVACGWIGAWDALLFAVVQLAFLLIFTLVGGALHEHRLELGIEFKTQRERLAERAGSEHVLERNRAIERAYGKFRVSKPQEGWQEIQTWLKLHGGAEDSTDKTLLEHRAVLAAVTRWDDTRAGDRLTDELVALYLARRETGRALEIVEERLAFNPLYRPKQPQHAVRLAELAAAAGKRVLRRQLEALLANDRRGEPPPQ
jgi:hypothetical protein